MKKHILLAGVLSALTLPAMADGFYLLGDVGQSKLEYSGWDGYSLSDTDTAYSFGAGFDLNQFVAIEVAYRDFGSGQDSGYGTDDFGDEYKWVDTLSITALQASIVGKLPISDTVNFFGRLGVGNIEAEMEYDDGGLIDNVSNSKTKALAGVGASFNITPEFAIRAEYNQYAKWDDRKISAFTVGATYHF